MGETGGVARGKDIELITRPASGLDQVKVDRGQIEQVIVGLTGYEKREA